MLYVIQADEFSAVFLGEEDCSSALLFYYFYQFSQKMPVNFANCSLITPSRFTFPVNQTGVAILVLYVKPDIKPEIP